MKKTIRLAIVLVLFTFLANISFAQVSKTSKYPKSFTLDKKTLDYLFTYKVNMTTRKSQNKYVDGSIVLLNSTYMENKQLKLKLGYFKNAEMHVQINGKDSKILYILTSDNSVFYSAKETAKGFVFTQCQKDHIFSE